MTNAFKGAALGATVAFAIATLVTLACSGPHDKLDVVMRGFGIVLLIASIAAVPAGACLGILAGKLRDQRLLVLEIIVMALVPLAGFAVFRALGMQRDILDHNADSFMTLVVIAAPPVALATIVLEWWTRPRIASPRF